MRVVQAIILGVLMCGMTIFWFWHVRRWVKERLLLWLHDRHAFGAALINGVLTVVLAAGLAGIVLLLLWTDTWWPQRLIPWIPLDRI